MGKVLSQFSRGFAGDVTRANDYEIISVKNVGSAPIPFGSPVFLKTSSPQGVQGFISGTTTDADFVGFAVRVPDKTPPTANSSTGQWEVGEPVDILVRGSMCVACASAASKMGDQLYIRKSDGALVNSAGATDTTVIVPNTTIRSVRDTKSQVEIVIRARNRV